MIYLIKYAETFFENPSNVISFLIFFCFVYAFFLYIFTRPPGEFIIIDLKEFKLSNFYKKIIGPK